MLVPARSLLLTCSSCILFLLTRRPCGKDPGTGGLASETSRLRPFHRALRCSKVGEQFPVVGFRAMLSAACRVSVSKCNSRWGSSLSSCDMACTHCWLCTQSDRRAQRTSFFVLSLIHASFNQKVLPLGFLCSVVFVFVFLAFHFCRRAARLVSSQDAVACRLRRGKRNRSRRRDLGRGGWGWPGRQR